MTPDGTLCRAQRDLRPVALLAQVGKDDGFRLPTRSVEDSGEELGGLVIREVAHRPDPGLQRTGPVGSFEHEDVMI